MRVAPARPAASRSLFMGIKISGTEKLSCLSRNNMRKA
jgi:hypothetical protein